MELLASVDLPGEAFLPQVSVQASCIFLRRRTRSERQLAGPEGPKQGPVFMAIAENCGHGRRGEVRYVRRPDGQEETKVLPVVERREENGDPKTRILQREQRLLADDLPWIAEQYGKFQAGQSFENA